MASSFDRTAHTADRIKEAMKDAGKKQVDLVRETGIDKGSISHYISGKYEPKQEAIYKLALALDVSEMWLWGYDVPKERSQIQKNNDTLADIVVRMRTDADFFSVVKSIYDLDSTEDIFSVLKSLCSLDSTRIKGVLDMLNAFNK